MTRFAHPVLSCVVLALASASANAQVAVDPGLEVSRDGKELERAPVLYVTKSDCDRNAAYEFAVQYTTAPTVVEAWVGMNGDDCSAPINRLRATTTAVRAACKRVGRSVEPTTNVSISVDAVELFSKDSSEDGCDSAVNQTYTLFFIPLPTETNIEANTGHEPLSGVGHGTLSATFTLYTTLPEAPSNLRPQVGAAAIGVSFDPLADAPLGYGYKAYFDWGSADDQTCGSGALVADMPAPDEGDMIEAVSTSTRSATLKDLDDKAILPETEVAVSVAAVDPAGNESLLAEPVCVLRLPRNDFIEPETKPKPKADSCSCRLGADGHERGVLGLGAWVVSAFVLLLRRRRA